MQKHEAEVGGTTLQSFDYEGSPVTFQLGNGDVMVNLTQMAKPFGKLPKDFLKTEQTREFIAVLEERLKTSDRKIIPTLIINTIQGGNVSANEQGTWAHQKVALKFAAWLNPRFELWVYDRIEELMRHGITATPQAIEDILADPDVMIRVLTELKEERKLRMEAAHKAELVTAQLQLTEDVVLQQSPKVQYYDKTLQSTSLVCIDMIAANLGISALALNRWLFEMGVQYRQQGAWTLTSTYRDRNLAKHKVYSYTRSDGTQGTRQHLYWTEAGREFITNLFAKKYTGKKSTK